MAPRRSMRRRRFVFLGALAILGILGLSLLALIQRQIGGETEDFLAERGRTLRDRLRASVQALMERERVALDELAHLAELSSETGALDPRELERTRAIVDRVFVLVDGELRWPARLERDSHYGEGVGRPAMDSTLDRRLLGRVYSSMASDPERAIAELQSALRRSLTRRARAEAQLLLASLLATDARDLGAAVACCDRVLGGEDTPSAGAVPEDLMPWILAALHRKGTLLVELGDPRGATRTLLALLERVSRPEFFAGNDDYTAFYRTQALETLSRLERQGAVNEQESSDIDRLRRRASWMEEEIAFRADLERRWLPALRAAAVPDASNGGVETPTPVRHLYLHGNSVPMLVAYRDESAGSGRILGFSVRMPAVEEELLRSLSSDSGETPRSTRTRILDSRKRPVFGAPSGVAEASTSSPLSIPFPAAIPWFAEFDLGGELTAFRHDRLVMYGGVFALAVLLIAAALWATAKGLNRQIELAELKSQFVANVSHELKTPLTLIRMYADLSRLGYARDAAQTAKNLELISREAENLSLLIDNVLDLSRIEAGERSYQLSPAQPGELVASVLEEFRPYTERKGFETRLQIEPGLPELHLDVPAFSRALRNLLSNAIKYSSDRRVVEVAARAVKAASAPGVEPDTASQVVVEVADRGLGFPPGDAERLFERFYRSARDSDDGARSAGTGIGLAIVKHVAESHGGTVRAANREGGGSVFTMSFPVRQDPPESPLSVRATRGDAGS